MITAAALLAMAGIWFACGKRHRFAYWIGKKSDAEVAALATNGWIVDRLQVAENVELVGLVRAPSEQAKATARWILFVPGNSSGLLDGFQQVLDELRGDDDKGDVGIAFWAYRGFEASTGTPDPDSLREDLDRQWQRLQELGATCERTEIWGYSLGSALAPHLAARMCGEGTAPRRLVLLATGMEIPVRPFGTFGRFAGTDVFEAHSVAAQVSCPVVVGHGSNDEALPIAGAEELAKKFSAEMIAIEGKGHANLWPEVRERIWPR